MAALENLITRLKTQQADTGRDTYRHYIEGLSFGAGPSGRIGFYVVRDGDSWEAITKDVGRGKADPRILAILNGYPMGKQPRAGEEIKVVLTTSTMAQ